MVYKGLLLAPDVGRFYRDLQNPLTQSAIALLSELPRLQAEVVLLRVLAGLDTNAVARLLGRSPGAVRIAGHRGLRRLAEILARAGVTL